MADRPDTGASQATGLLGEEWRPVPTFEGAYEISSLGRVRSLHFAPPKVLSPTTDKDGYPTINLYPKGGGRRRTFNLHRLVCRVFNGEQPNPLHNEVAHIDGNRANCRADNLKWVSKVENHFHMRAHGTSPRGERHPRAKLTAAKVRAIRAMGNVPARRLAEEFGVSPYTIADVRLRRRWGHVE